MMKYSIPSIKLNIFTEETVVTGSADLSGYVGEAQAKLHNKSESEYKARTENFNDMLKYN